MENNSTLYTCIFCKTEKTRDAFFKKSKRSLIACKICTLERKNKKYLNSLRKFYNYDITEKIYLEMLGHQFNACKICKNIFTEKRKICIDHDHVSGEVRGLLCYACNTGLGYIEKQGFLPTAREYIEDYRRRKTFSHLF